MAAKKEVQYAALGAMPRSFGREAGEWALDGEVPERSKDGHDVATFAGGCFWGTELHYMRLPGVISTCVGYTQGRVQKPSYEDVCRGVTGHTEACQLVFDPEVCSFESLCAKLFETLDPTEIDRVGQDWGTQYRHGIYCHTAEQLEAATAFVEAEQPKYKRRIVTEVKRAALFWPAEEHHQQYLAKGGRFGNAQSRAKGCTDPVRCYG